MWAGFTFFLLARRSPNPVRARKENDWLAVTRSTHKYLTESFCLYYKREDSQLQKLQNTQDMPLLSLSSILNPHYFFHFSVLCFNKIKLVSKGIFQGRVHATNAQEMIHQWLHRWLHWRESFLPDQSLVVMILFLLIFWRVSLYDYILSFAALSPPLHVGLLPNQSSRNFFSLFLTLVKIHTNMVCYREIDDVTSWLFSRG